MATSDDTATDLLRFIDASPTPFHAVREVTARLVAAGYLEVHEADAWSLTAGTRAFVVRGGSSVVALEIGAADPQEHGVRFVAAHTDSPNLRVKPNPDLMAAGTAQLAVEPYGGALLHTWLDRDLGLAGRVLLRRDGKSESHLVDLRMPLLRIPSLAIHLNRTVNTDGLQLNAQKHMPPLFALATSETRDLRALIGSALPPELEVHQDLARIQAWDLMLTDTQPSTLLGASNEFVSAPRLDNLASCHAAVQALTSSNTSASFTRAVALFDHEEVGSRSAQGAAGALLRDVLARAISASGAHSADAVARTLAKSFLVSADMAHALHPNYVDKHEPAHQPILGGGPVVKSNSNQSYATDASTWAHFESLASAAAVPTQRFVTRSDLGCGSTVGPLLAASLGVPTVDVGLPMLSMHSCRELAATSDVSAMIRVLEKFFSE